MFDAKYLKNVGGTGSFCVNHYSKLNAHSALAAFGLLKKDVRLSPSEFLVKARIQTSSSISDECFSVVQFFHCSQVSSGCFKTCALFFYSMLPT